MLFALTGLNLLCRAMLPGLAHVGGRDAGRLCDDDHVHRAVVVGPAAVHHPDRRRRLALRHGGQRLGQPFLSVSSRTGWPRPTRRPARLLHGRTPSLPLGRWLPQMVAWGGFMLALAAASLCVVAILRQQWVDRERLTFPTVALPLALVSRKRRYSAGRFSGSGRPARSLISCLNTLALNVPAVPLLNLRGRTRHRDSCMTAPPWNADRLHAALVLSVRGRHRVSDPGGRDVLLLVLLSRDPRGARRRRGAQFRHRQRGSQSGDVPGSRASGRGGVSRADFGLAVAVARLSKRCLGESTRTQGIRLDDSDEPLTYRRRWSGLALQSPAMVGFCAAAGMNPLVALVVIVLALDLHGRGDPGSGRDGERLAIRAGRGCQHTDDPDVRDEPAGRARPDHPRVPAPRHG